MYIFRRDIIKTKPFHPRLVESADVELKDPDLQTGKANYICHLLFQYNLFSCNFASLLMMSLN
jgi:hypothetical protein